MVVPFEKWSEGPDLELLRKQLNAAARPRRPAAAEPPPGIRALALRELKRGVWEAEYALRLPPVARWLWQHLDYNYRIIFRLWHGLTELEMYSRQNLDDLLVDLEQRGAVRFHNRRHEPGKGNTHPRQPTSARLYDTERKIWELLTRFIVMAAKASVPAGGSSGDRNGGNFPADRAIANFLAVRSASVRSRRNDWRADGTVLRKRVVEAYEDAKVPVAHRSGLILHFCGDLGLSSTLERKAINDLLRFRTGVTRPGGRHG